LWLSRFSNQFSQLGYRSESLSFLTIFNFKLMRKLSIIGTRWIVMRQKEQPMTFWSSSDNILTAHCSHKFKMIKCCEMSRFVEEKLMPDTWHLNCWKIFSVRFILKVAWESQLKIGKWEGFGKISSKSKRIFLNPNFWLKLTFWKTKMKDHHYDEINEIKEPGGLRPKTYKLRTLRFY
jgi:hypothetical protein